MALCTWYVAHGPEGVNCLTTLGHACPQTMQASKKLKCNLRHMDEKVIDDTKNYMNQSLVSVIKIYWPKDTTKDTKRKPPAPRSH